MTTENILYPCIDCGILPSFCFTSSVHACCLFCAGCGNGQYGNRHADVKEQWNGANHPDKLKEMINPCNKHPIGIAYNIPEISRFYDGLGYAYHVKCNGSHYESRHYFSTPKEAIEKWNAENPREEKC